MQLLLLEGAPIKLKMSTAFHPQSDRLFERLNQTTLESLRVLVNCKGTDWAANLQAIEFAFNSTVHATGVSPFWVSTGSQPEPPQTLYAHTSATNSFVASYTNSIRGVRDRLLKSQE